MRFSLIRSSIPLRTRRIELDPGVWSCRKASSSRFLLSSVQYFGGRTRSHWRRQSRNQRIVQRPRLPNRGVRRERAKRSSPYPLGVSSVPSSLPCTTSSRLLPIFLIPVAFAFFPPTGRRYPPTIWCRRKRQLRQCLHLSSRIDVCKVHDFLGRRAAFPPSSWQPYAPRTKAPSDHLLADVMGCWSLPAVVKRTAVEGVAVPSLYFVLPLQVRLVLIVASSCVGKVLSIYYPLTWEKY